MERYDNTFRSLLTTLVPPAVFIAVLAMQLRFFRPSRSRTTDVDFQNFMPVILRNAIKNIEDFVAVGGNEDEEEEEEEERRDEDGEAEEEDEDEQLERSGQEEEGDPREGNGQDIVDSATEVTAEGKMKINKGIGFGNFKCNYTILFWLLLYCFLLLFLNGNPPLFSIQLT